MYFLVDIQIGQSKGKFKVNPDAKYCQYRGGVKSSLEIAVCSK